LFHLFFMWPVPAGTGSIKKKWNKKALEDDNNYISEQEKIETSEASETPANQ
jgi:DNA-directed RNA polymerase subunit beta'